MVNALAVALSTVAFFAPNLGKAIQQQERAIAETGLTQPVCRLYGANRHMVCSAYAGGGLFLKITYTPVSCSRLSVVYTILGLGSRKTNVPWNHDIFKCKTKAR